MRLIIISHSLHVSGFVSSVCVCFIFYFIHVNVDVVHCFSGIKIDTKSLTFPAVAPIDSKTAESFWALALHYTVC